MNNQQSMPLDSTTFYQLLRDQGGYTVLSCGKLDLDKPGHSFGIDGKHRRAGLPSLMEVWGFTDGIDNAGKQDGARRARENIAEPYAAYLAGSGPHAKPDATDETYSDNWIARNGLALIRSVPKGKPWFLIVNFNGPHPPFDPTAAMLAPWETQKFPPTVPGDREDDNERRKYAAEIVNIDHWLAVYREELRQRGELDHTIIAYSSDHGEMLHDHGFSGKEFPLNPSACVPLVIAGPGIRSNLRCPEAVETLDLAATFLDYAGVPVPAGMDSQSMRPYLEGRGDYPRKHVTCALDGWALVCDGRSKLIAGNLSWCVQPSDRDKSLVLDDLEKDPAETLDVASAHPDLVAKLQPLLPPLVGKPPKSAGRTRK